MSEAIEILKSCDAFLEGHFLLSSGRHSSAYCQMAYLQQYPDRCAEVMAPVAAKIKELGADVIVGPAMGGIVYAYELARQTGLRAIFTGVVDRTKPEAPSPIPILASALKLDLPNYAPEECPLCKEGKLPLVHLGSRKMSQQAKQTL